MSQTLPNQTLRCPANSGAVLTGDSTISVGHHSASLSGGFWSAVRGRSQFVVNVISNAGGNALNSVLQLLLLLALGRFLDKGAYAAWFAAGSIIAIGEVASDFGTRLWAVKRFASNQPASHTFRLSLYNKLVFTLAAVSVLGLLPLSTLSLTALVLSLLVASTQPGSDPFLWYLRGKERLDVEAGLVLSCRLAIVAALAVTAMFKVQLVALLLVWLLFNVCRMVVESRLEICRPLFVGARETRITLVDVWKNVREAMPIGVSLVLAPMFTQCALLFVTIHGTESNITEFGAAFRLVLAAGFVGTSIVVSSFARLSKSIADGDQTTARQIVRTKFLLLTAALTPICIAGMLLSVPVAEFVSRLTLKPELATAGHVMVLLMPGLYLSCINMGAKFSLNAFGLNRQDVMAMLIGFVTLVLVFSAASGVLLPVRAALCWTCGEVAVLSCRFVFLKKQNRLQGIPVALIAGALCGLVLLAGSLHLYR